MITIHADILLKLLPDLVKISGTMPPKPGKLMLIVHKSQSHFCLLNYKVCTDIHTTCTPKWKPFLKNPMYAPSLLYPAVYNANRN